MTKPRGGGLGLADLKIRLTPLQLEWLREQSLKTGNPISALIRNLIQSEIDKSAK